MADESGSQIGWRGVLALILFWLAVVLYIGGLLAPLTTTSTYFSLRDAVEASKRTGTSGTLTDAAELFMDILEENPTILDEKNTYSVVSGIGELYEKGEIFLVLVLVLFSILFPCAKLISLFLLCCDGTSTQMRELHLKAHAFLGKWSMLDVFVIALLVVSLKLGDLVNVQIHEGVYFFATSVLLTMILTHMLHRSLPKN